MLLRRVADASAALVATPARTAKRKVLAELMTELIAEADPHQAEVVATWLGGALPQRRTGIGWATLARLPPPVAASSLTVHDVDRALDAAAGATGEGSAERRRVVLERLFGAATREEQRLLVGLISGELRHGALESAVQEGIADALGVPATTVRQAAMLLGATGRAAAVGLGGGRGELERVGMTLGVAVQPMLAAAAPNVAAAVARLGLPLMVDHKLDGIRIQAHRDGADVRVFTRSLDDITDRLPEVVAAVRALPHDRLVLDGEVVALRPDGRPAKFQVIAARTASRDDDAADRTPIRAYFFDLLFDDSTLLGTPLIERAERMAQILPERLLVPRVVAEDEATVADRFASAVAGGFEGLVVKKPDAAYTAGRRQSAWTKIKPRHTLDLLVIAAEWGHGRRHGYLSNLHLAARGPDGPVMLGKTFKGLTDDMLRWQTEQLLAREVRRTHGTVQVRPDLVVEVAFDGVQDSTRYPGGVTLRFARVLRYRPDKPAEQADTLDDVRALDVGGSTV